MRRDAIFRLFYTGNPEYFSDFLWLNLNLLLDTWLGDLECTFFIHIGEIDLALG